jgi:hypothetical protein
MSRRTTLRSVEMSISKRRLSRAVLHYTHHLIRPVLPYILTRRFELFGRRQHVVDVVVEERRPRMSSRR